MQFRRGSCLRYVPRRMLAGEILSWRRRRRQGKDYGPCAHARYRLFAKAGYLSKPLRPFEQTGLCFGKKGVICRPDV
uniref:Uncharacterized protein n=1 Tax=Hyaloperonospora arabidopsidis (strain Emoy2) TaxID=559515 RepID=M4C1P3_HYAAE